MTTAVFRIMKDIQRIKDNPVPGIHLMADPANCFNWFYILEGSDDTPFFGGFYFGRIMLPKGYPFDPPRVQMVTPSGRFMTDKDLCFSYTNYHPEMWAPTLNPQSVALGLLSYMNDLQDIGRGTIRTETNTIRDLAYKSAEFNLHVPEVREFFPECVGKMERTRNERQN